MFRRLFVFMMCLFVSSTSFAQQALRDCTVLPTTVSMNECWRENLQTLQATVNDLFDEKLKDAHSDEDKKDLIDSKNTFSAYLTAECTRQGNFYRGGTFASIAFADCEKILLGQRIDALKASAEGPVEE